MYSILFDENKRGVYDEIGMNIYFVFKSIINCLWYYLFFRIENDIILLWYCELCYNIVSIVMCTLIFLFWYLCIIFNIVLIFFICA